MDLANAETKHAETADGSWSVLMSADLAARSREEIRTGQDCMNVISVSFYSFTD
jgi:hypothetical protein